MTRSAIGALVVSLCAGAASGTLVSFASDIDDDSFTFRGNGSGIFDAADPSDPFTLWIDDDNGPLPRISFGVEFQADFEIDYIGSTPLGGSSFVHVYALNGEFSFVDLKGGSTILSASITNGAFTAIGGATSWNQTATIQANDHEDGSITYQWLGSGLENYGLFEGMSIGPDDASFTLTVLQHMGTLGVDLGEGDMLPEQIWNSEGSFSGSMTFVPSPSTAVLLGLSALLPVRRRRR